MPTIAAEKLKVMPQSKIDTASSELTRTERKKQKRTQKLLQTAAEVFAKKGYDKTSLEDIAEQMDMRAPSLYHYVKTKEELFMRCANVMVTSVFENLEQASNTPGCPMQRLEKMLYVQILGQLRDFYPNHIPLFVRVNSQEAELKRYITGVRKTHFKIFSDVAEQAALAGQLDDQHWRLGLRLAFGSLGSLHQWYQPEGETPPEEMARDITKRLLRLITPAKPT